MMLELVAPMITGPQIKAARTLLGWSVGDLARRTGMNIADTRELEDAIEMPKRRHGDVATIQAALQDAGIKFIDSVGVHFGARKPRHKTR
jgi:transcriptional regulator with XRE-family HTH domain